MSTIDEHLIGYPIEKKGIGIDVWKQSVEIYCYWNSDIALMIFHFHRNRMDRIAWQNFNFDLNEMMYPLMRCTVCN